MGNKIEEGKSVSSWEERISAIVAGDGDGLQKSIHIGTKAINISRAIDFMFARWDIEIADNSKMIVVYSIYDDIGLVDIEIPDKDSSESPGLSRDFFAKSKNAELERLSNGNYRFSAEGTGDEIDVQTMAIVGYVEEQMAKIVSP